MQISSYCTVYSHFCSHLDGRQLKGEDGADAQHHGQAGRGIKLQDLSQCGTVPAGLTAQPAAAAGRSSGEGGQQEGRGSKCGTVSTGLSAQPAAAAGRGDSK